MRILYVEDNEINAMIIDRALDKHGHQVTVASDPNSALNFVSDEAPYDLVLMDINLGETQISGTELMYMIKQEFSNYAGVPFFALTSYARAENETTFLTAGFDRFYPKPIDVTALLTGMASVRIR